MRRFFHALVLLGVFATPALAQEGHWYTAIKGGVTNLASSDASSQGVSATLNYETGGALLWTVGYAFNRFRVESELSWRRNDLESLTLPASLVFTSTGTRTAPAQGRLRNFAWMVNGVYPVPITDRFTALLLGGVGYSRVMGELVQVGSAPVYFDEEKTAFAYQVGVGAEYPLSKDFALEVAYRFFGTPDVEFGNADVENIHHTGLFGLTMKF